jgi:hypothetical protein
MLRLIPVPNLNLKEKHNNMSTTTYSPSETNPNPVLAALAAAYDRARAKLSGGDPQEPQQHALALEERVHESRQAYHDAVAKLSHLEAEFEETDFSAVPVEVFQAREAAVRQQQVIVDHAQEAAAAIETEWAQQREAEEKAFVQQQKQIRLQEVEAKLTEIGKQIPAKQLLLNRLPIEIETLRQRSFELMRERAGLL